MSSNFLSFKLSDKFVSQYKEKEAPFGYPDAAGNSIGEIVFIEKYSRLKEDGSKERWYEACERIINGMYSIQKDWAKQHALPWNDNKAQRSAEEAFDLLFRGMWSPPGRGISAMGSYVVNGLKNSMPLQNCAVVSTGDMTKADPANPFCFLFDVGMLGVGIGTDTRGAEKGFVIYDPSKSPLGPEVFVVPDSREGWVEALRRKLNSYLIAGRRPVELDTSLIRPKGAPIKTFGGTAPGPAPLEKLMHRIDKILGGREGELFNEVDIADIMNMVGVCIVSGNVRRMAELILGDYSSKSFINLKNPSVFSERNDYSDPANPGWGHMSNNTVMATPGQNYDEILDSIKLNGEPGIIWMDNIHSFGRSGEARTDDYRVVGANPCCLTADSWIMTDQGPRQIHSLKGEPFAALVDGRRFRSNGSWISGTGDVYRLKAREGFELKLTPEHRIMTAEGEWVEAKDLRPGTKIRIHSHQDIQWGDTTNLGEGYLMGLFVGDGNFGTASTSGQHVAHLKVWSEAGCDAVMSVARQYAAVLPHRSDWSGWNPVSNGTYYQMAITGLPQRFGMTDTTNKHQIAKLEEQSSSFYVGFLRGMFDSDGHVEGYQNDKGLSIRLSQSNYELLQAAQRMLQRLGIMSRIYKGHPAGLRKLPDGKGGVGEYDCKANYRLIVSAQHALRFVEIIGFTNSEKMTKCTKLISQRKRIYRKPFVATVDSFEYLGKEEVWDAEVEEVHAFDANGIYAHNSEQFLESKECCTLADLYLTRIPDKAHLRRALKYAFLYAKTVTLLPTHLPETNAIMQRNRRIGLSVSGAADFMDTYGRGKLRDWLSDGFEWVDEYDKTYSEWLCIRESIRTTTVKPAGTTGLTFGVSPGAHWTPGGQYFYRVMIFPNESPALAEYKRAGYRTEPSVIEPETSSVVYFPVKALSKRSEKQVSIFEKAALAALLQECWSNNGVSVTLSFDPETEGEHIKTILEMYDSKLKSVSFLPMMAGTYAQAPFTPMTSFEFEAARSTHKKVDLSVMYRDGEEAQGESGCTNDVCEIKPSWLKS